MLKHTPANHVPEAKLSHLKMRPKALKALQQERLSAKEQVKAAANVLQHVGVDMDQCFPSNPLKQISHGQQRHVHNLDGMQMEYISSPDGSCIWDVPEAGTHTRLVLNPDEGSALYSAYEWLAQQQMSIGFRRDELPLASHYLGSRTGFMCGILETSGTSSPAIAIAS